MLKPWLFACDIKSVVWRSEMKLKLICNNTVQPKWYIIMYQLQFISDLHITLIISQAI
jgi:hypothetical protein